MTRAVIGLHWLAIVGSIACGNSPGRLPEPPRRDMRARFPVSQRPACSNEVLSAMAGGPEAIAAAARRGLTFTCNVDSDETALDRAVLEGEPRQVRALLEAGADPNTRWANGDRHPLQGAIESRSYSRLDIHQVEIVRLLLEHGADANAGWCPFETRAGHVTTAGCTTARSTTPLAMAAARGEIGVLHLLLRAGADPLKPDWSDATPLDQAATEEAYEVVLSGVIHHGEGAEAAARADFVRRFPPPYGANAAGVTLIDSALRMLHYGRLKLLLSAGADPNVGVAATLGCPPLTSAVRENAPDVVETLLDHGANANARACTCGVVHLSDPAVIPRPPSESTTSDASRWDPFRLGPGCTAGQGLTPLMDAALRNRAPVVASLLRHGADASLRDWRGRTATDFAARHADGRMIRLLRSSAGMGQ